MSDQGLLEVYVERLAALLHDHIDLLDSIDRYVSFMTGLDEVKKPHLDALKSQLRDLSTLRSSIVEAIAEAVEFVRRSGGTSEALSDFYALLFYFAEAGIEKEIKTLKRASSFTDVEELLDAAAKARDEVLRLARYLEGASR